MDLNEYLLKLKGVLATRKEMIVVARTDASDVEEIIKRVEAFADAGADAVLVDGLRDLCLIRKLKDHVIKPFAFNQIARGKSSSYSLREFRDAGVSLVIYSTPCLFAAQGGH